MNGEPVVSIIVPIYNVREYLAECLESVRQQSFTEWECILINDGSTDGSGTICNAYAGEDNRFKVIHQANSGVSSARNAGLNIAKAPFLSFIDSDDYISLNFYESILQRMQETGAEYGVSFFSFVAGKAEESEIINHIRLDAFKEKPSFLSDRKSVIRNIKNLMTAGCWGSVYSRNLWEGEHFPVGVDLGEDLAIIPKIIIKAEKAVRLHESTYFYRRHTGSLTQTAISKERYMQCLRAGNQMYNSCKEYDAASGNAFSEMKFSSNMGMYSRYLKGNPDIAESKLLHFLRLIKEASEQNEQR